MMPEPAAQSGGLIHRRRFIQLAIASGLLTSLTTNCRPSAPPPTDDTTINFDDANQTFDWRRFAGAEISLLLNDHPWTTGLLRYMPDFKALTGINPKVRVVAELEYFTEMEAVLRADSRATDAFFLPMDSTAYRLWSDDLLLPLTPLLNDPELTAADYNLFDFPEGFRQAAMYPPDEGNQQLFGIPATFESYILFGYQRKAGQRDIGCNVLMSTLLRRDKRLCGIAQSPVSLPVRIQIGNDDNYFTRAATTGCRFSENAGSSGAQCDS